MEKEELLQIKNLSVDYKVKGGYLSAVHGVSFEICKGEIFAIVGESGCGKSTIAHSILRLLPDHNEKISGEINFQGQNLNDLSEKELEAVRGHKIGMIFQNPLESLNPVYTTGKQVQEGLLLDNIPKQEAWNRVVDLFKDVQMPDAERRARSFPHELSGGMRQRVMIAMMLGRNPDLLIADEPTTALDVTVEAQILRVIKELRDERNMAVMLITHNFGLVAEVADMVGVMYAGEMVETGTVYEIFDHPSHPYTMQLMKALPRITKKEGRLETIRGAVPKMMNHQKGCRFANRCIYATEKCWSENPPVHQLSETHSFACFREEVSTCRK